MATKTTSNDLQSVRPLYDRLYAVTKKLHDDFAGGQTTIERHTLEEMLAASQGMLLELKAVLDAVPAQTPTPSDAPAPKRTVRKAPVKKTTAEAEDGSAAEKAPAKKTTTRKTVAAKASAAEKPATEEAPSKKAPVRKTTAKKVAAKSH